MQGTVQYRAQFNARNSSMQDTVQRTAQFNAGHSSTQGTVQCRAQFNARHSSTQGTVQHRAQFNAGHSSTQGTVQCRAQFNAGHSSMQGTVQCRAQFNAALSAASDFHFINAQTKKTVNLIKIRSLSAWGDLNNARRITHVSYLTTSRSTQDTERKLRVLRMQQTLNSGNRKKYRVQ